MSKTTAIAHPKARTVRFGLDEEPARKKAASAPAPQPAVVLSDAPARVIYAIEPGIPIPVPDGRRSRVDQMPFRDMRVGDSIFVPGLKPKNAPALCKCMARRTPDRAYISRGWPGGARIWRTK